MAKRWYYRNGGVQWIDDEGHSHREDGPAVVWAHDRQWWCRRGRVHFAHGPADLWPNGMLRWYKDDRLLRERDPYG